MQAEFLSLREEINGALRGQKLQIEVRDTQLFYLHLLHLCIMISADFPVFLILSKF